MRNTIRFLIDFLLIVAVTVLGFIIIQYLDK